jgi:hypothetical protein
MAGSGRRGLYWAIAGGVVLLIGIVALLIASLDRSPVTTPAPGPSGSTLAPPGPTSSPGGDAPVVDESAAERGWVPEPVTTDPETYVRAALAAGGTFDTTSGTYEDWIAHLGTWFTPDTRYTTEDDRQAQLDAVKLEMRQAVVFPETEWDSLAREDGRVESAVSGDVTLSPVPQDDSGDMFIGTADVTITFTRSDGDGGEVSYDESIRLSVQVLCGAGSVPAPDTPQRAGDCKLVRFFSEPVEP